MTRTAGIQPVEPEIPEIPKLPKIFIINENHQHPENSQNPAISEIPEIQESLEIPEPDESDELANRRAGLSGEPGMCVPKLSRKRSEPKRIGAFLYQPIETIKESWVATCRPQI